MVMMANSSRFRLIYALQVKHHLQAIDKKYYPLIRSAVEERLQLDPDVETRNRKPLKRESGLGADWEIRFGPQNRFRVFYTFDLESREVHVLAIGIKRGSRLFIGGEEVLL